ncbi:MULTISPECIES: ubiquinone/menaquinone biosynthesis methyltransferase [unclassified Pseudodesulfovibrio]|uniref:ubiquinone/menaquinone biosynthesis methyltransferase n=1 Tax=unclassified Pseudodesulfovibrio TaxID=2661612 RepID=UPI000FEBD868|nr:MULTISPECIES: ubiquinone/menaquinone biosynthesis methyltransferase [unclassified Pseudodesulfovibrio]MCJ2165339.1 ubiquinone/menaquinone biosynthesis methyltransferase [Pseudodesulfovibrio sp. S3-i]RWU02802.1 methyltransferase domain-containing protein [Pseudodesulfovibrio sp. S3]
MTGPECESHTGASTHAEHGKRVADMFGRIAGWYDFLNHALSLGQDIYWRYRLAKAARPEPGGTVLDLAAGTMDVSMELLRQYPDCRVAALDFALPMLETGKAKKLKEGREERIFPVQADGRLLPLPDECMSAATIAFGIRNILPREEAYAEFFRVLKPGTRLCILEFGTGSKRVWKGLYNFYLDTLLPFIGDRISGDPGAYRYLAETIKSFPDERALGNELLNAGFERVYNVPMMSGIVYLHVAEKPMAQPKASAASVAPEEVASKTRAAPKKSAPKAKAAPKKSVSKKKSAPKKGTKKK